MSLPSLLQLLAAWTADKRLDQHVLGNETFADAFFRYLEEVYGCGNLASHVAHGCMLDVNEYLEGLLLLPRESCPCLLGELYVVAAIM